MLDTILRHCNLPDGRNDVDIGIADGKIAAVATSLQASAAEEIDAAGQLISPPFVDAHFHMDSTLSFGLPRVNQSGTLLEGIALWGELKPLLTQDAIVERAMQYCDWAVARVPSRSAARRVITLITPKNALAATSPRKASRSRVSSCSVVDWNASLGDACPYSTRTACCMR